MQDTGDQENVQNPNINSKTVSMHRQVGSVANKPGEEQAKGKDHDTQGEQVRTQGERLV